MVTKLYSIYDSKTQVFFSPMTFHSDDHAKRQVKSQAKSGIVAEFPEDFSLYCLGDFNDSNGLIERNVPARLVCRLDSLCGDAGAATTPFLPGLASPPSQG